MYTKDGEQYYIVDGHVHFWDASPANQANKYGEGFIKCCYDYHRNLSPEDQVWSLEKFQKYSEDDLIHDLFEEGGVDVAIFQPTYLKDFYINGFNTTEQDAVLKEKYPGALRAQRRVRPAPGRAGARGLRTAGPPLRPQGRQALHRRVAR